jgi:hypothetical protein
MSGRQVGSGVVSSVEFEACPESESSVASISGWKDTPEVSTRPKRPVRRPADAGVLPDFSDDPDDDTDEDIANVPLDYGA